MGDREKFPCTHSGAYLFSSFNKEMLTVVLIVLVLMVWACFAAVSRRRHLPWDLDELVDISTRIDPTIGDYDLVESSRTKIVWEKEGEPPCIYLCLNRVDGSPYDRSTVLYAFIHELAHLECPDEDHTTLFYEIEDRFINRAVELGMITKGKKMDVSYPSVNDL